VTEFYVIQLLARTTFWANFDLNYQVLFSYVQNEH